MRERAGIAAVVLVVVCAVYPGVAGASLPGTGEVGDGLDDVASGTVETVEETASGAVETVEDTASGAVETVEETASGTVETVEDTASGAVETVDEAASSATKTVEEAASSATKTVEEAASSATKTVEEAASSATQTVEDTTGGPVGSSAGTSPGGGSPGQVQTAPASDSATSDSATADTATADTATADTATGDPASLEYAAQQPDGRGSFLALHDSLGWSSLGTLADPATGTAGHVTMAPAEARAEPRDTLVATVRVRDGREPFVANVDFGTLGGSVAVRLDPTGGSPLVGPDDGAATERFPGLVVIAGEDPFRADVQVIVRDDGLVLLVEPERTAVAAVTEVLSRMVERLASTGLPLLVLAGLALGLTAAGGFAVRAGRTRRWAGAARAARP